MKRIYRLLSIVLLFIIGTALFAPAVSAATVTVTLLPGPLAITDAPSTLVYTPAMATNTAQTFDASFTLAVTDATGRKAGWHIDAALRPLMMSDGTSVPPFTSAITRTRVTGLTGIAPFGMLVYPRPFRADSDTIFSADKGSGAGKSSLAFDTEITVPADATNAAPLSTTLSVTIAASP